MLNVDALGVRLDASGLGPYARLLFILSLCWAPSCDLYEIGFIPLQRVFCNNVKERYYCDSIKDTILGHEMYNFDLKVHYSWNKYLFFIFIHFVFTTS